MLRHHRSTPTTALRPAGRGAPARGRSGHRQKPTTLGAGRRARRSAAALAAIMLVAGCSSGSEEGTGETAGESASGGEPSYLFVVDAESGTVDADTIMLTGVDQSVMQFTDRPYRSIGYVGLEDFARSWNSEGFAEDPPDAAISWVADGTTLSTAVELTSFDVDGDTATLTFATLEGSTLVPAGSASSLPDQLSEVSIVIDSARSASNSERISLALGNEAGDSLTVDYAGLRGNQPATNDNTLFVWEGTVVGWNAPPLATQKIDSNTADGSVTIDGLDPKSKTYTVGYAVGSSPSGVASTATTEPGRQASDSESTSVTIVAVAAESLVVSYQLPTGATADGHWVGVWEGSSIEPGDGPEPVAKADISDRNSRGAQEVSVEMERGTVYTVGYFVGSARSELAATTTFVV